MSVKLFCKHKWLGNKYRVEEQGATLLLNCERTPNVLWTFYQVPHQKRKIICHKYDLKLDRRFREEQSETLPLSTK